MKRIGLAGENPNDGDAIKNLLVRCGFRHTYKVVGKNIRGDQLDTPKFRRILNAELSFQKLDAIVLIRDLDSIKNDKIKINLRLLWAENVAAAVSPVKSFFLLNIAMLESLILADIDCFNKIYKSNIIYKGDPEMERNPKAKLIEGTSKLKKKYSENDADKIFSKLDIEKLKVKNKSFRNFLTELKKY